MSNPNIIINRTRGGSTSLDKSILVDLRNRLEGSILLPRDPGWDEAIRTWNGMAAGTPALVVQPRSAADVVSVVDTARNNGFLVSIRGAGHNIAGTSIAPGGITIDMSQMRSVSVDHEARLAHVGPGCVLGDVDRATQEYGLATVLGFVSETGVAGLTLGGGWGYLSRRFGWTVDNLQEIEIVTADGRIRVSDRERNSDLFWAVRGGGGNFGIVTRFTFRLHDVGPAISGGLIAFSAERAEEILRSYQEITADAPRELTVAVVVRLAPPAPFVPQEWQGKPIVAMVVCYSGDDAEADLAPIRKIGDPVVSTLGPMPYTGLQSMLNAMEPKGLHRYWKTEFLSGLSEGFLEAFRDGALGVTSPLSQSVIFHLAGAINEHAPDDGAVGNRDVGFISGFSGTWPPGTPSEPHIGWVRKSWERIRGYSTGGNYVNFQLADDNVERLRAAYGENYERLQRVKAQYDPDNFFRINRNIPPV